jgi:hypothetical protein
LLQEIEDARKARLASDAIPPLLAALRAGDDAARIRLQDGLRFLLYQDRHGEPLEISDIRKSLPRLGARMLGIIVAVGRLMANDQTDAVKFVSRQIWRAGRNYWREESREHRNIEAEAPSSTNWDRKQRGAEPHKPLYRQAIEPSQERDGFREDSPLEIQKVEYMPADFAIANELAETVTRDDFERDVLRMRADGYPVRTIAATLATTKHQVEMAMNRIRQRATESILPKATQQKATRDAA